MSGVYELISKLNVQIPRYTSYPTAPMWDTLPKEQFISRLVNRKSSEPLSLYIHIPFCHSMCLYCACSVVINRNPENEELYTQALLKEIEITARFLPQDTVVNQVHFGGGTPTKLSEAQLVRIVEKLHQCFTILPDAEISMEIDPRTVVVDNGDKLRAVRRMGFNRVSFGVQDTDPQVQEAIKRRQSLEMTQTTFALARSLNFSGINIDLIYGLPCQTEESFEKTVSDIVALRPDRIALFSYAKVPHLKAHQKAIADHLLPTTHQKFRIYQEARNAFIDHGYTAIGMDHFAESNDPLTQRFKTKTLLRNFQGYTVYSGEDMVGLGVTSISFIGDAYFQNSKDIAQYHAAISTHTIPLERGMILTDEDKKRRFVINRLMCDFSIRKNEFKELFGVDFDTHFSASRDLLQSLIGDKLVTDDVEVMQVTEMGEMFIRNIASCFDEYLPKQTTKLFSKAI